MNLDRRLLKEIIVARWPLLVTVLAGFLSGVLIVLQARQVSRVIAAVFLEGRTLEQVMPLLWLVLGLVIAKAVLSYLGETAAGTAAQRVKEQVRLQLASKIQRLGPAFTQGERSGELVNTASQGIEALDAYFSQYLPQLALAGLLPLAYLMVVFPLDPLSGLVLLLTGPLIPLFMFLIGSTAEDLTRKQWLSLGRMSAYFLDTLQGIATLKALGRSREQGERIARVSGQYRETTLQVMRTTFLSALVLELLSTIGTAIIAVEIGLRLLYGRMGFEGAFFLLLLAPEFYLPLRALGLRFHASMAGVSAARRIYAVLEHPEPAPLPTSGQAQPGSWLREPFTIAFHDVDFSYSGRELAALSGISLEMHSGQMIGLVGASGAGKSSIASLLLGFTRPQRGTITLNGMPLDAMPVEDWRSQVAWVPQQTYLFHGTLADNLLLANPGAIPAEMRAALEKAHLADWVDTLNRGLLTSVGEGGARLSGGQAQRLALARAFLRNAPLVILDEPTAHLDVEQERRLQESIRWLCAGRTVLVIAHRLSTVAQADEIVVLDQGRVVERGKPADLLARGSAYAHLLSAYRGGEA